MKFSSLNVLGSSGRNVGCFSARTKFRIAETLHDGFNCARTKVEIYQNDILVATLLKFQSKTAQQGNVHRVINAYR